MGRKPVPNKEKKLKSLYEKYGNDIILDEFIKNFKKEYPKDWKRIEDTYDRQVIQEKKKGKKPGPMPEPEQYLKNMYKSYNKNR